MGHSQVTRTIFFRYKMTSREIVRVFNRFVFPSVHQLIDWSINIKGGNMMGIFAWRSLIWIDKAVANDIVNLWPNWVQDTRQLLLPLLISSTIAYQLKRTDSGTPMRVVRRGAHPKCTRGQLRWLQWICFLFDYSSCTRFRASGKIGWRTKSGNIPNLAKGWRHHSQPFYWSRSPTVTQ